MNEPEKKEPRKRTRCQGCGDYLDLASIWEGPLVQPFIGHSKGEHIRVCGDCYGTLFQLGFAAPGAFTEESFS